MSSVLPSAKDTELEPLGLHGRLTLWGYEAPSGLSFEAWLEDGQRIRRYARALQFAIGDWINVGEQRYGEKYLQALEVTEYSLGSLQNMAYVARNVKLHDRREDVSYSHHQAVAALPAPEQREVLRQAAEERLDVEETRSLARKSGKRPEPPEVVTIHKREYDRLIAIAIAGKRGELERLRQLIAEHEGTYGELRGE